MCSLVPWLKKPYNLLSITKVSVWFEADIFFFLSFFCTFTLTQCTQYSFLLFDLHLSKESKAVL